jgi:hypothetical protein
LTLRRCGFILNKEEGREMKHIHKYTSVSHPGLTSEAMSLGIKAAEIRRCETCKKETTFIQTKKDKWMPLFKDEAADEQNILLA